MLKIIIPLASDHFIDESGQFNYPLPLIEIKGKSVIEYVLSDLDKISGEKQLIFILKEQDCTKYNLDNSLKLLVENPVIVPLKAKTKGAVCSILIVNNCNSFAHFICNIRLSSRCNKTTALASEPETSFNK
jgi:hypothetical protein